MNKGTAIGLLFLVFGIGCASHIHQPSNLALAQKAQEQFAGLSKSNDATFESMLTNLVTFSKINADLYASLAKREAEVHARGVTSLSWSELRDSLSNSPLSSYAADLRTRTNAINKEIKKLHGDSKEALKVLVQTGSDFEAAKAVLTSWNRKAAVLEKLIESAPTLKTSLEAVDASGDLRDKIDAYTLKLNETLGEQSFSYLDADGNSKTNDLASELKNILNLNDFSLDNVNSARIIDALRGTFSVKAPGLIVTAASLAKDLAEAESARIATSLASLEHRLQVLNEAAAAVRLGLTLSQEGASSIPAGTFPNDDIVRDTIRSMSGNANANADTLSGAMLALAHYVTINSEIVARAEEALRIDAQEQHFASIRVSELNLRQQQAMAARGLESLVVYHGAGVKPQEIAELAIQVAQLGLLSWIGAGVN